MERARSLNLASLKFIFPSAVNLPYYKVHWLDRIFSKGINLIFVESKTVQQLKHIKKFSYTFIFSEALLGRWHQCLLSPFCLPSLYSELCTFSSAICSKI